MKAHLLFLGRAADFPVSRLSQPSQLSAGDVIPLELKHVFRWQRQDVTRVIIGSNPERADVLLVDDPLTIGGEHARFYLNHNDPAASHLRPMKKSRVILNGQPLPEFEWFHPKNGDEIQFGAWRFRFEM